MQEDSREEDEDIWSKDAKIRIDDRQFKIGGGFLWKYSQNHQYSVRGESS